MQTRILNHPKIQVLWNSNVLEAQGSKLLEKVVVLNNQTKSSQEIPCAGLFYAVGHQPNTAFLNGQITLDETGYIITQPDSTATQLAGVFAAGDVKDHVYRQAITAAGSGCMAALEAERWLAAQGLVD
jgi:thioredoxin reductase (NADPH)